jgi:hypothetical protein
VITPDEYLAFVDRALDGMSSIITMLGDELANRVPAMPGANSPYAILHHCLGVMEYWAGHLVAGRSVVRDRDAEFVAAGTLDDLLERTAQSRQRLAIDVALADFSAPLRGTPPASFRGPGFELTQGAALLHVYEELAQHHGQMEITRDLLVPR